MKGNLEMIRQLLSKGADINNRDEFQRTVLHLAMNRYGENSSGDLIKLLINKGADLNILDHKGRTPLHYLFVKQNRRNITLQYDPVDIVQHITLNQKDLTFLN